MKKISAYLSNYTAPSSGFSEGRLKDDPGDGTGSGITVNTHNDFLYGFLAPILKWLGAVSETDESETASDMLTAIERIGGIANENVSEYVNSTTYAQDAHVMYLGVQFVSMVGSNTGNNPFDNPLKWMPCFGRDEALRKFREGHDIEGGFAPIHDKRNATYFRSFWSWGKYNFGGASGRNFQGYGVHLDGQILTGNADYVSIFDIGGAHQYPLLDIIAPEVLSVRTMLDSKGRVPRIVDATAGSAANVGVVQADQMQQITGAITPTIHASSSNGLIAGNASGALSSGGTAFNTNYPQTLSGPASIAARLLFDSANSTAQGGARTGAETRMKNYSVGLRSVFVLKEI